MLFHIANQADWELALETGVYKCASLETEGFIHLSRIDQVLLVANAFYKGQTDLILLQIDPKKIAPSLKYETFDEEVYPHLYSSLKVGAVVCIYPLQTSEDGSFQLPESLR
jgi:uncharacterized protein (DUF952 family)